MMSFFKWIVYSNIWISLSVISLILYSVQVGILDVSFTYIFISFFATLFAYNFQRVEKLKINYQILSERHVWINKNINIIKYLTLVSFIITIILVFFTFSIELIIIGAILSLFVLFYAGNQWIKISLRSISYLKIFLIALVWTFVVVILPVVMSHQHLDKNNTVFSILIFLYISTLCIPFDIRDLKTDDGFVKTIPYYLGVRNSILLSMGLLVLISIIAFYYNWIAFSFMAVISAVVISLVNEKRKELFYTGIIDGLMLMFPFFHFFIEIFQ